MQTLNAAYIFREALYLAGENTKNDSLLRSIYLGKEGILVIESEEKREKALEELKKFLSKREDITIFSVCEKVGKKILISVFEKGNPNPPFTLELKYEKCGKCNEDHPQLETSQKKPAELGHDVVPESWAALTDEVMALLPAQSKFLN